MDGGLAIGGKEGMRLPGRRSSARYIPPSEVHTTTLTDLIVGSGRFGTAPAQAALEFLNKNEPERRTPIYYAGDVSLLRKRCVAIVGTREVSEAGRARAQRLARVVVQAGAVVVSGLAFGVDTVAHTEALAQGGRTIAVIGTPLDRCNPMPNAGLQQEIYERHLLVSQFPWGSEVFPTNFPKRNRTMAALCDVTVIVEASDTSGTLHQAVECVRLKRHLLILRSVVDDPRLTWPQKFLHHPTVHVLSEPDDLIALLR